MLISLRDATRHQRLPSCDVIKAPWFNSYIFHPQMAAATSVDNPLIKKMVTL